MQDAASPTPQRYAERYLLLERLHAGASTEVWLAEDQRAQIAVALKLLDRSAAERDNARDAFEREWRIGSALNHPNTVRALSWHAGERPAYAMQYIDGTDFSDLVGKPFEVWASPLLVIIDTLVYWHRKGVVHGDLKPANLLLDRRGVAYLADFGAAATLGSELRQQQRRAATSAYASAEQRAGELPDAADDVYAIAQVIVELACGDPAGEALHELPPTLAKLIEKARGERSGRPTLNQFCDALKAVGVRRGPVDLQSLNIALRRPAASVAGGAAPGTPQALPHGAFERQPVQQHAEPGVSLRAVLIGLAVIAMLGIAVSFLPRLFSDGPASDVAVDSPSVTQPEPVAAPAPAAAQRTSEERVAARLESDRLVAEVLSAIDILEQRAAERWAGVEFSAATASYQKGDRAYLASDYALANTHYNEALAGLRPLLQQVNAAFERAMRAGDDGLNALDASAARDAFDLALAITPDSELAAQGLQRATNLDAVISLVARGELAERNGQLAEARELLSEAVALDDRFEPAAAALARVNASITQDNFETIMSRGFVAMDAGDFTAAQRAFERAVQIRPTADAPRDALLQLTLKRRLERITGLQSQATQAESAERWGEALAHYQSMLEIDPNLDVATEGVVRVSDRIELLKSAASIVANPDQLSETDSLREASALLTRLNELTPQGPELSQRKRELENVLVKVAIPIPVTLQSDGQTNVTLLRVSRLGAFTSTEVRLRPGLYTLVGSRRGFVDVRRQFRVRPGETPAAVFIACDQPI
ncbi:MAG: serine/threonine-protein kinase [Pseudomonadota bacterium]